MDALELKDVRKVSARSGLEKWGDKIKLKRWCRDHGIEIPHIHYMSNDSPEVPDDLLRMDEYVAKPTHLADSSFTAEIEINIPSVTYLAKVFVLVAPDLRSAANGRP